MFTRLDVVEKDTGFFKVDFFIYYYPMGQLVVMQECSDVPRFRMDVDQAARSNAQEYFGVKDPDYYEFEGTTSTIVRNPKYSFVCL